MLVQMSALYYIRNRDTDRLCDELGQRLCDVSVTVLKLPSLSLVQFRPSVKDAMRPGHHVSFSDLWQDLYTPLTYRQFKQPIIRCEEFNWNYLGAAVFKGYSGVNHYDAVNIFNIFTVKLCGNRMFHMTAAVCV